MFNVLNIAHQIHFAQNLPILLIAFADLYFQIFLPAELTQH